MIAATITYGFVLLLGWREGFRLSLAGVTGLIVAIGITADSFIVYFERVRDEVREGRTLQAAVETGWARARRTILAADTVSFLAALVLYILAIGSVRGFAFTLGLTTIIDVIVVFLFTKPIVTPAGPHEVLRRRPQALRLRRRAPRPLGRLRRPRPGPDAVRRRRRSGRRARPRGRSPSPSAAPSVSGAASRERTAGERRTAWNRRRRAAGSPDVQLRRLRQRPAQRPALDRLHRTPPALVPHRRDRRPRLDPQPGHPRAQRGHRVPRRVGVHRLERAEHEHRGSPRTPSSPRSRRPSSRGSASSAPTPSGSRPASSTTSRPTRSRSRWPRPTASPTPTSRAPSSGRAGARTSRARRSPA